jgi:hypothetical protein
MNDTQRGADGGEGRDGMVTFFDAVADDPEMTPEQKIHWLRITAADYLEKLESAEMDAKRDRTLAEGHQMRFDALLETMQREAAKSEAIEQERDALREVVALMDIDGKRQAIRDDRVDSMSDQRGADGAGLRVTSEQVEKMLLEAQENWPRLGRMQCGELADIATKTTHFMPAICRDWFDMQARLEAAQRLYDASTPGLMIGDVLGALEVFRTTMEATDGT